MAKLATSAGRYRAVRFIGDVYAFLIDEAVASNAQTDPVTRGQHGLALAVLVNGRLRRLRDGWANFVIRERMSCAYENKAFVLSEVLEVLGV